MRRLTHRYLLAALIALVSACANTADPKAAAREIALGDATVTRSATIKTLNFEEQEQLTDNLAFHYKAAIGHDPKNIDAHKKLARVYYDRGRTLSCFFVLNETKTLIQTDEEVNAGLTSFATKSMATIAAHNGRDLTKLDPVGLAKLGRCYFIIGNTDKAKELLIKARDIDKTNGYVLASIYELQQIETGAVLSNAKTTAPPKDPNS
ncbi:MAG: hypothetical protein H7338_05605 [Candidatus Sericytochromatia bacterium]|nr:hypothetical protein [Candidatus Sericytochromatia bacterium]